MQAKVVKSNDESNKCMKKMSKGKQNKEVSKLKEQTKKKTAQAAGAQVSAKASEAAKVKAIVVPDKSADGNNDDETNVINTQEEAGESSEVQEQLVTPKGDDEGAPEEEDEEKESTDPKDSSDDSSEEDEPSETESGKDPIIASCGRSYRKMKRRLDGLPMYVAGVRVTRKGSATIGHQLANFHELMKIKKSLENFFAEYDQNGGHVKAVHDMLKTFTEAEKAGATAHKSEMMAQFQELQQKVASDGKENEESTKHELKDVRNMLHDVTQRLQSLESNVGIQSAAPKRKSNELEDATAKKIVKMDGQLSSAEKYKKAMAASAAKEKKKKAAFACVFCVNNDHKSVACNKYSNTTSRKERMADLGMCGICGRIHGGTCRFQTSRPCAVCGELHLTYLCVKTFDKD